MFAIRDLVITCHACNACTAYSVMCDTSMYAARLMHPMCIMRIVQFM